MKTRLLFLSILSLLISCNPKPQNSKIKSSEKIVNNTLQSLLDSNDVNGAILVFDFNKDTYYSNNFTEAQKSVIPASTYKIPHSIIGLETVILENENTVFEWDENERNMSIWEKDLTLKQAFQLSCVPCYQELARKIGPKRMNKYLAKLDYGQMDVNEETIDNFWLIGQSKISPFQQINFIKRLYNKALPISASTTKTLIQILQIEKNKDFTLSGKTGLALNPKGDIGWFVGYIEKDNNVYYFATRISPNNADMPRSRFINLRKSISLTALKALGIIKPASRIGEAF